MCPSPCIPLSLQTEMAFLFTHWLNPKALELSLTSLILIYTTSNPSANICSPPEKFYNPVASLHLCCSLLLMKAPVSIIWMTIVFWLITLGLLFMPFAIFYPHRGREILWKCHLFASLISKHTSTGFCLPDSSESTTWRQHCQRSTSDYCSGALWCSRLSLPLVTWWILDHDFEAAVTL